jgi:hypothetical protein
MKVVCDNGESGESGEAKGRLVKVFRFLKELDQLRNPVRRDLNDYQKFVPPLRNWLAHPCIEINSGDHPEKKNEKETASEADFLIRVKRANITPCPPPPDILEEWLRPGWQSIDGEVEPLQAKNFVGDDEQTITVAFKDDEQRVRVLENWKVARAKWADAERPAVEARRIFELVHALWTAIQREGDRVELVLADGILSIPELSIRHPVLLQKIILEFDPATPEFRFSAGTEKIELHKALLRLIPNVDGKMIAHFDNELDSNPVEPLGGESTEGFFRRLIQGLFTDGEYQEQKSEKISATATIWRDPLVILRPHTAGLSTSLDFIISDLENGNKAPPEGLSRIVGIEEKREIPVISLSGAEENAQTSVNASAAEVLFSKPANAEQYEIANRLAQSSAVLVQGPPGTGKTHTIANLLGHLLSQGKTVLVTAHTTKALRVLRRHCSRYA